MNLYIGLGEFQFLRQLLPFPLVHVGAAGEFSLEKPQLVRCKPGAMTSFWYNASEIRLTMDTGGGGVSCWEKIVKKLRNISEILIVHSVVNTKFKKLRF